MRVLLVDDQVLFREGLAALLATQPDLEVVGRTGSIREALSIACDTKPDVMMTKLDLPDGCALDAPREMAARDLDTKVVFLTVHEDDESIFEALRGGASGYLPKNTPVDELLALLRGLQYGHLALPPKIVARIVREFARRPLESSPTVDAASLLTAREMEVLRALARGATNREIAQQLMIAENTVKNHVRTILSKLHLRSRTDAGRLMPRRA